MLKIHVNNNHVAFWRLPCIIRCKSIHLLFAYPLSQRVARLGVANTSSTGNLLHRLWLYHISGKWMNLLHLLSQNWANHSSRTSGSVAGGDDPPSRHNMAGKISSNCLSSTSDEASAYGFDPFLEGQKSKRWPESSDGWCTNVTIYNMLKCYTEKTCQLT